MSCGSLRSAMMAAVLVAIVASLIAPLAGTSFAMDEGPSLESADEGTHLMTTADVEELKAILGVRDPGSDYNVIIGGHGTGYAPPTEEDYAAMVGQVVVRDALFSAPAGPSSYDLSTDPRFPAVGDQGSVGSCAAWAMAYYCYGYLEAKDNDWTDASSGDPQQLLSPSWAYNKVNGGTDRGSWMGDIGDILCTWGGATLSTMPYVGTKTSASSYQYWGGEAAFREAPLHRALSVEWIEHDPYDWSGTLDGIKAVVSSGTPVTFALNAAVLNGAPGDTIVTSSEYISGTLNHAQTIVGYDDGKSADGEMGAFKVVNSWGDDFWGSGYYWITYDAFIETGSGNQLVYITDRADYAPSLLGVWHYSSAPDQRGSVTVTTLGGTVKVSPYYEVSSLSLPSFLCLDLSDLKAEYDAGRTTFRLTVLSDTGGTLSSFRTELYSEGYLPGRPTQVSAASPDVPTSTINNVRSVLQDYATSSLGGALDAAYLDITTGGNAAWAPSMVTSTKGGLSAQSGDVSLSSDSWLNLALEGKGTLDFDWRMDCPSSTDTLTLRVGGAVAGVLTGSQPWAHMSIEVNGEGADVLWTFLRQGNGGGCAWIDNVTWLRGSLYIDGNDELISTASMLDWAGSGTSGDPYVIDGYLIDRPSGGSGLYVGNTTLYLRIVGCQLDGGDRTGLTGLMLFNVINVEIEDCTVLGSSDGVVVKDSSAVTLRSNIIIGNSAAGILVVSSEGVVLTGNNISGNAEGLRVGASELTAHGNLFRANTGLAIRSTSSPGCLYYENAFMGNNGSGSTFDAGKVQAADDSASDWYTVVGNYWSDLTSPDDDLDGFVDTAYPVGASADHRPMVSFIGEPSGPTAIWSGSEVILTWSAPDRAAYAVVTGYELLRTAADGEVTMTTTALSYVDSDVAYGACDYAVRALTTLGLGPWSARADIYIPDIVPPTVTILTPSPGAWYRTSVMAISWSGADPGSGISHYEVSIDGGAFQNRSLSTSYETAPLASGAHQVSVRAVDRFGNDAIATVSFNLDAVPPVISIVSPIAGSTVGSSTVTFSISVRDAGSGYHRDIVRVDGQLVRDSTNANTITFTLELADGPHRLAVTSTDRAGNFASVNLLFNVDKEAPAVSISFPSDGLLVTTRDVLIEWAASDMTGLDRTDMSVDGGDWVNVTGLQNVTLRSLADASHSVVVRAIDLQGHISVARSNFTVDATVPVATMVVTDDLPRDGPLLIRFSEPVNITTMRWSALFDGTVSWDGNDLMITPSEHLAYATEYRITLSANDLNGRGSGEMVLTFRTTDKGTVVGVVLDSSGHPLAGALVTADDGSSATTDQYGRFALLLTAGPANLTIRMGGHSDAVWEVDVAPGETIALGNKQMSAIPGQEDPLPLMVVIAIGSVVLVLAVIAIARRRR